MKETSHRVLSDLDPKEVFYFFEEISSIPHGSGNTKAISDHLALFAEKRGLKYRQDDHDNIIIWKDASPGYEAAPAVILQGHMDMVCVAEDGYETDFEKDGLILEENDGIITAKGTSLGGDDGIAVAMAMAILDSDKITHPPLEVIITSDEEIGMLGAAALDLNDVKGKILLNLDSEDEGFLLVSCAGGATVTTHMPVSFTHHDDPEKEGLITGRLEISSLTGGHSGVEIDKGRANAFVLLSRALDGLRLNAVENGASFYLSRLFGGGKDNAIPDSAYAIFSVKPGNAESLTDKMNDYITNCEKIFKNEFKNTDKDLSLKLTFPGGFPADGIMDERSTDRVIDMLRLLPNGIQNMSTDIPGLVQTSLNMGILKTLKGSKAKADGSDTGEVAVSFSVRSSVSSQKQEMIRRIRILMDVLGGSMSITGDYPAWEYMPDSKLRPVMEEVFEKQYGKKPVWQAIHAGVECGIFASKIKGLDAVSFGPDMKDIHSPRESMDSKSVKRTWDYLLAVLEKLKS